MLLTIVFFVFIIKPNFSSVEPSKIIGLGAVEIVKSGNNFFKVGMRE